MPARTSGVPTAGRRRRVLPPYSYIPSWPLRLREPNTGKRLMSAIHWRVLMALGARHNKKTGRCFPSYVTIAADTGDDRADVGKALADLKRWRIIDWCETTTKDGRRTSNCYVLLAEPPPSPTCTSGPRDREENARADGVLPPGDHGKGSPGDRGEGPPITSKVNTEIFNIEFLNIPTS